MRKKTNLSPTSTERTATARYHKPLGCGQEGGRLEINLSDGTQVIVRGARALDLLIGWFNQPDNQLEMPITATPSTLLEVAGLELQQRRERAA